MQIISLLIPGFYAFIAAIIGSVFAVLAITRDTETIAFGALVSLYILPSVVVFELLNRLASYALAPHIGFWLVSVIIIGYFYYLYNQSLLLTSDDGSGLMALHTMYATSGAALFSYVVLFLNIKH